MKKASLILILLFGFGQITYSQTVTIGKQVWMTKNLDLVTFKNGDTIPEAKTITEWFKASQEGKSVWCYPDNSLEYGIIYGKLYNWYAVNDPRGIAPKGFHISSKEEWEKLIFYLGGEKKAGKKLLSNKVWEEDCKCTNESGFSALPGSGRDYPDFGSIGIDGQWWTSTENDSNNAWYYDLSCFFGRININNYNTNKGCGMSIRCLKD